MNVNKKENKKEKKKGNKKENKKEKKKGNKKEKIIILLHS